MFKIKLIRREEKTGQDDSKSKDGLIRTTTLYHTDGHSKFYTLRLYSIKNNVYSYKIQKTWGKIGTKGTSKNDLYKDQHVAKFNMKIKVNNLLHKGYKMIKDEWH